MGFVDDLENKVRDYLTGEYEVTETKTIPSVEQVPFGKKAKKMKLCAFCIDLRKSSDLLTIHQKQTSGKIHKAFLTTVASVVNRNGGKIRSFNGDGLLAFWPAYLKEDVSTAVRTGMNIKWLLDQKYSSHFDKYSKIDFGIGIDWGEVYILRAGISRESNNNDLIFIGPCVNFATAIANQAYGPGHVEISNSLYSNLENDHIYTKKDGRDVNMWNDGTIKWKGESYKTKVTSYWWTIK